MKKNASKNHLIKVLGFVCILTILAAASALPVFSSPAPIPVAAAPDPLIPFTTYTIPTRGGSHDWEVPVSNTLVMPKMDIVYVFDTTGSMNTVKPTLASTINGFTAELIGAGATDIYWGAVFFGDMDVDAPWFGIDLPLGDYPLIDVQTAITNLRSTGGGDTPEDALAAYMRAIDETPWRQGAQHVIVLVTDATTKTAADPPRNSIFYGGHPITYPGAVAITSEHGIIPCIMTHSGYSQLGPMASALGVTEYLWSSGPDLLARLRAAIIAPDIVDGEEYEYEARVISVTYESDGAPSTDVTTTIVPSSFWLASGESKKFELEAIGEYNPYRFDETTIVEIGYYVRANADDDWVRIESATQYIRYRVGAYSVIYDTNTTDPTVSTPPGTKSYREDDEVTVEGVLTREGIYEFRGWNTEADGSGITYRAGDTFTMPNEDVTLYAMWYPRPIGSITKEANETAVGIGDIYSYTLKMMNAATSSEDWMSVVVTDILPTNLEFIDYEIINTSGAKDEDDVDVDYDLATNTVTITCGDIIKGIDDDLEPVEDRVVEVKIIVKLISGVGGEYVENTAVAESINEVPKSDLEKTLILYTVTYDANGGVGGPHLASGISYDSDHDVLDISIPTGISNPGFTFLGWNTKADGTGGNYYPGSLLHVIIDITLYARWYESRTVTYHANGGVGGPYALTDIALGSNHFVLGVGVPVNFSRPGYIFLGWKDETGMVYDPDDEFIVDSDKDLYAQWVKITYEANGGTGGPYIVASVLASKEHTILARLTTGINRVGCTFVNWNTEADGTGVTYNPGENYNALDGDITFYAQWVCTITYEANGGVGDPYKVTNIRADSKHTVLGIGPPVNFSRPGYTFLGWGFEDADDNVDYDVGDEITMEGDMILFAKWI
ncbi:MAG: InlB B-repeat-containing protein, partial [Clostridiales bacterium]|nr:InlB B-repeat-containing protein [Clostridiales bacterium]